jgi:transaldolase
MAADGGDYETVPAWIARAGVNVDALAAQVQDRGSRSFVNFRDELKAVIAATSGAHKKAAWEGRG